MAAPLAALPVSPLCYLASSSAMKLVAQRLALLAFLAAEACSGLTVKRGTGPGRVAVRLASESVAAAPPSPSRFVELSRSSQGRARALNAECPEEGCAFVRETSSLVKTQQERLKKKAKKLKKHAANLRKQYLENHTEEQYEVLKFEGIIQALEGEINGGNEGAEDLE
ncbi:hypothetical protein ACSSS7_003584 [Eimeria intestinalis]